MCWGKMWQEVAQGAQIFAEVATNSSGGGVVASLSSRRMGGVDNSMHDAQGSSIGQCTSSRPSGKGCYLSDGGTWAPWGTKIGR